MIEYPLILVFRSFTFIAFAMLCLSVQAYQFKYDSIHGRYKGLVEVEGDNLIIDGQVKEKKGVLKKRFFECKSVSQDRPGNLVLLSVNALLETSRNNSLRSTQLSMLRSLISSLSL